MARIPLAVVLFVSLLSEGSAFAQDANVVRPNYQQAAFYSGDFLRQRTYSTSVRPGPGRRRPNAPCSRRSTSGCR